MSLRLLLTISGGLEALVGVLTLISPAILTDVLTGGSADAGTIVLARIIHDGPSRNRAVALRDRHAES